MARKTEQTWIRTAISICCLLFCFAANAEEELEYKMDIGAGLGGCFYIGDANSAPFANLSAMGAITARRILNARMAVKANLAFDIFMVPPTASFPQMHIAELQKEVSLPK